MNNNAKMTTPTTKTKTQYSAFARVRVSSLLPFFSFFGLVSRSRLTFLSLSSLLCLLAPLDVLYTLLAAKEGALAHKTETKKERRKKKNRTVEKSPPFSSSPHFIIAHVSSHSTQIHKIKKNGPEQERRERKRRIEDRRGRPRVGRRRGG